MALSHELIRRYKHHVLPIIKEIRGATRLLHTAEKIALTQTSLPVKTVDYRGKRPVLYEPGTVVAFTETVTPGDVVADIGGFHGFYGILAATLGAEHVTVFEEDEERCQTIKRNVEVNEASDAVDVVQASVRSRRSSRECWTTLDHSYRDTSVDTVKIDVEGWESLVLRGSQTVLRRDRPTVFLEVHRGHGITWSDLHPLFPDEYRFQTLDRRPTETLVKAWGAS